MANSFVFDLPKFLDPEKTLFAAGLAKGQSLADLGTGGGFYAVAAAKIVGEQGLVYAVDIVESALNHISAEARVQSLRNIKTLRVDLEETGACLSIPGGTMDYVLFANLAHQIKNQKELFTEGYRQLKTGGKLIVIEWNDQPSPIGPIASERIGQDAIKTMASQASLKESGLVPTDNYHYGLVFVK